MSNRWKKPHFCPLDPMCRQFGTPPARLYFVAFGYSVTVAFTPSARLIDFSEDMSKWTIENAKWISIKKVR